MNGSFEPLLRREFLGRAGLGLGAIALRELLTKDQPVRHAAHHPPRARHVIQLFMAGAPSQFELFEPKPVLQELGRSGSTGEPGGGASASRSSTASARS